MWTKANRARYNRDQLRYPGDVTEEEWGQLAALIPPARVKSSGSCKGLGSRRGTSAGVRFGC